MQIAEIMNGYEITEPEYYNSTLYYWEWRCVIKRNDKDVAKIENAESRGECLEEAREFIKRYI